jgi:hypothetical protein
MEVRKRESHNCFGMSDISIIGGTAALLLFTVHVRLVDFAGVPEKVLHGSETTVTAIFHKAGVEVEFVDAAGKADLVVQILKDAPRHLQGDVTGFAVLVPSERRSDSYAAVSYPMVEEAARGLDADVAEVLAGSMAHELGHLLLKSSAHSRAGVMIPRLDRRQITLLRRGELLFTAGEAARMRTQLAP